LFFAGIAGIIVAVYTLKIIKRQTNLMQAQFDQWVELGNWGTRRPEDRKLRINVDLVNPTGFPMMFSGKVTIGKEEKTFDKVRLNPKSPKTEWFDMAISKEEEDAGRVSFPVKAIFIHSHKITQEEIIDEPEWTLDCVRWKDHTWHAGLNPQAPESNQNKS
jgi:hypothetical protein